MAGKPHSNPHGADWWQSFINHRFQTDGRKAAAKNRPVKSVTFSVPVDVIDKDGNRRIFKFLRLRESLKYEHQQR
jgi:hypothetical protein